MSEKLKIKLSIANRIYPLTIDPSQEEGLRIAAQKIEVTVKKYEQSYSVKDKQDVLAMCALQFAAKEELTTLTKNSLNAALEKRLNDLDKQIESHLNNDFL
ncbi:MAG: cell division protein ZapA [Bacteroidota bacterium]|nr:cell division protein ZapA [Bacteroidota bacterium]